MTPPSASGPRRAAVAVWVAMLALPPAFLALSEAVAGPRPPARAGVLFWVAVAASILGIALSRLLPRQLTPRGEGANPEAVAFTRLALAWGVLEGVAIFPLVARLLAPDPRLLAVSAVDLVALLALFPGRDRWASLGRYDEASAPGPERG